MFKEPAGVLPFSIAMKLQNNFKIGLKKVG